MKLIPIEQRKNKICHFCGTDKSVKYTINNIDNENKIEVCCCNKCVTRYENKSIYR